ncbi:MAG: hypothetical protein LW875_10460 [Proteobacteria bacterium]|nr:hypothetical protein [Pseudomonadota bacterium]
MKKLICLSLVGLFLGCVTPQTNPYMQVISAADYEKIVTRFTDREQVYDGFQQVLGVSATLVSTDVARAQLDQNARLYQWTPETFQNKKSETETNLSKQTEVFVSFYVPERKHDDLQKANTTWKIFLDAGGKRYEGKAQRMKNILAEIQALYPEHNRFSTAYRVTFPVPTSMVDSNKAQLTMTGPVGSATLDLVK